MSARTVCATRARRVHTLASPHGAIMFPKRALSDPQLFLYLVQRAVHVGELVQ